MESNQLHSIRINIPLIKIHKKFAPSNQKKFSSNF